ncbi:MAG: hypothetical protein H0T42_20135 [Deltaproteobacteria bacterium]|nr:hypothetical protein [Deltaproteobacteria bacterium]
MDREGAARYDHRVMLKKALLGTVGIAALVLNPFFGCGDESFRYGADEMRAAIEGTWKLTVPADGTTPAQETVFSISQAATPAEQHSRGRSAITEAAACVQRSLVKSAGACLDSTEMPIEVKLLAGGAATKGTFEVFGFKFTEGMLRIELGTSHLRATVAADGSIIAIHSAPKLAASLIRVSTAQR